MNIYKLTQKAIKKNKLKLENPELARIVFRENKSAILFSGSTLIESDLFYPKPDSHVELSQDDMPTMLHGDQYQVTHILDNRIDMLGIKVTT